MVESRTQKTLLNAKYNLIFLTLNLFIAFFSRKIFLNNLGIQFVGLTSTVQSLLGFLNMAEMGIGVAIGVSLYKPLAKDDKTAINEIVSVLGYMYRIIGSFILFTGVILSCFLPFFIKNNEISLGIVYVTFYAFLFSSLFSYFINYKQILLSADQKNYVVTKYIQTANIIKLLLQILFAYYFANIYVWVGLELLFGLLACIILNVKIKKTYPWLKSNISIGKKVHSKYPHIAKYAKQLFLQKFASFAGGQLAPLLIFSFVSLEMVACSTNYTTIISKFSLFMNSLLGSSGASVGNLIADKDREYSLKLYGELFSSYFLLASIFAILLFYLTEPFIALWLGKQYILGRIVLLLLISDVFIQHYAGATYQFLAGYGLFKDIWASIAEIIIYISLAIVCGYKWGLNGILLAAVIKSVLICAIWKPYFLFTEGFHEPVIKYWKLWLKHIIVFISVFGICELVHRTFIPNCETWLSLIVYSGVFTLFCSIIMIAAFYWFIPQSRSCFYRLRFFLSV